ncbi:MULTISPECIES: TIGR03088 family PEP-CTERM/XrtA system glycosyltransferase [unclassified Rubrivivax]|uniref:TIGR03088 family PEP-CTERM/XrtA system glycosyltransferase n=1 Tax=unclassified Rubrivivax TaxID=2649762 RepID=UPI001E2B4BA5|nr:MULTISPECIES: TIGR03088 family PEP-CTERM/XrtA system glycosyltransferase [unclassified Rubrivivax]MCC9596335.1 TIGR03088 family PEP-CTERM/XrtA system glycosyltransferase [Rubrivivax sp. JA1055]MCC9647324.1 TIGR03088 family PEP-CTERM/XrtA system glycosyltransferase [Rubrivivax sp. JA1029]
MIVPIPASRASRPLVLHLVYRFDTGGLENGVVNLINHMPADAYRHAVVALTEVVPGFASRIQRDDVEFVSLHKPPGHGVKLYPRLAQVFRQLKPAVVHTRNLAALEFQVPAAWCGVPARVHGEHGRDVDDPDGTVRRYQWMRRAYRPFVHRYVALSQDLAGYLEQRVGVPPRRIVRICNGVDTRRFCPATDGREALAGSPFADPALFVAGTVGRMQTVKAQPLLARAFVRALELAPRLRPVLRLVMVGDGPLRAEAQAVLAQGGAADLAWLPGERRDVPELMRSLDAFVLPSLAEGISNTILEAMASGLPVLATRVGGNAELVDDGTTGALVPAGDVDALAAGLVALASDPAGAAVQGAAGRRRVVDGFSLDAMVGRYRALYDELLGIGDSGDRGQVS